MNLLSFWNGKPTVKMILDMISLTALTLTVFGGPTDRVNDMQKYLYILFATLLYCKLNHDCGCC